MPSMFRQVSACLYVSAYLRQNGKDCADDVQYLATTMQAPRQLANCLHRFMGMLNGSEVVSVPFTLGCTVEIMGKPGLG